MVLLHILGLVIYTYVGGIVGRSYGSTNYIQNCLNYGTITHRGTTNDLCLGGIVGYTYYANADNCLSGGKISVTKSATSSNYIGSVVGYVGSSSTNIKQCYWSIDIGRSNTCGSGSPTIDNETSLVSLNTTTMGSPNNYKQFMEQVVHAVPEWQEDQQPQPRSTCCDTETLPRPCEEWELVPVLVQ